jgi:hypothetical protein
MTFVERADTATEMRDLIVKWLRDQQSRADKRSVDARTKKDAYGELCRMYAYRNAAEFWEAVVIQPKRKL